MSRVHKPLNNIDTTFLTAGNLLDAVLEFTRWTPDSSMWYEVKQKKDIQRLYRIRRIKAMFEAFGLNKKGKIAIKQFIRGDFIENDDAIYRQLLANEIEKAYQVASMFDQRVLKHFDTTLTVDFVSTFECLLDFIDRFNRLDETNGGVAKDPIVDYFISYLFIDLKQSIDPKTVDNIRRIIELIIDPKQQRIKLKDLIEKYNYPNAEL